MKIVLWTSDGRAEVAAALARLDDVEIALVDDPAAFAAALPGAEGLVMMSALRERAVVEAIARHGDQVRWLQLQLAGWDVLRAHGVPAGIRVATVGDVYAASVAEHAMALVCGAARGLRYAFDNGRRGAWDKSIDAHMHALEGATLAIVGFGAIGRAVARRARAFDMRIVGLRRSATPDPDADAMHPIGALHAVLGEADFVLVAAPLTAETRHMIGAAALAACKPGAVLVNVARGALVDHAALRAALADGRLAAAALDVTDPEPLPADDPLWRMPNVIVTPHVGGRGHRPTFVRIGRRIAENVERYRAGLPLRDELAAVPRFEG
jgi:phosphoglycerate dehydrogenase-like enzyme